jgi:hypothetical protein
MLRVLHDRSQARKSDRRSSYDIDPLDVELRRDGIEMIAPHRSNRSKPATKMDAAEAILVRWEYYPQNFRGFVQLACLVILFRWPRRASCAPGGMLDHAGTHAPHWLQPFGNDAE